ncbi:MAG: stage III sporulation protein AB [Clostridia bacterium]|nr:stage III sporulation protein AB [Clostridia bacterium]
MKWAGIGLLALSIMAFGGWKQAALVARVRTLRAAQLLCRRVGEEIRFTAAPPTDILAKLSSDGGLRELPFLATFAAVSPAEYASRWQAETADFARKNGLSDEETAMLAAFGAALGTTDAQSQQTHCAAFAERFKTAVATAEKDVAEKGRLYLSLGLLGALAAALFCI